MDNEKELLEVVEETEENTAETAEVVEETEENTAETAEVAEETAETVEKAGEVEEKTAQASGKKLSALTIFIMAVIAVALIVAAVFAVKAFLPKSEQAEVTETIAVNAHHTNAHGYPSWSVFYHIHEGDTNMHYYWMDEAGTEQSTTADEVNTAMDTTIAACGAKTMDNRTLQYYYSEVFMGFANQYYNYLSYMMDTSAPFDEQKSALGDGTQTWQQYFLDSSLKQFHAVAAVCQEAQATGFTLSAEEQDYLNSMLDLQTLAAMYGAEDPLTLLRSMVSPVATEESYQQYITDTAIYSAYLQNVSENLEITEQEIADYYAANEQTLLQSYNLKKVDKPVVNVRHILVQPEAAEDGTITEEAWAAAEAKAQELYDTWKAGEATEDTFSELAKEHSADGGSQSVGGLYEDVYPGQMVEEFESWCFDDARATGDTGIVKTSYGYHIMYYVSQGDYIYWQKTCEDSLRGEKVMTVTDEIVAKYEMTQDGIPMILDGATPTMPTTQSYTAPETEE